jgi:hypothetical protein
VLLPVSGLLTDPGTVCPGSTVVLNCTTPGNLQTWIYNGASVLSIIPGVTPFPANVEVSGVMFSISLLSSTPDIESQISFVASSSVNGRTLVCSGSSGETDSVTFMVGSIQGNVYRQEMCVQESTHSINVCVCVHACGTACVCGPIITTAGS